MKQHAISIAAIFLALAIGVVLGSQTLASGVLSGLRDDKDDLSHKVDELQNANNQLEVQIGAADSFDATIADRTVKDVLAQRSVIIVTTPDADAGDVDAVTKLIQAAGAAVTGKVGLTTAFVDNVNGERLKTSLTNIVPAGIQLKTGAVDTGSIAGDLLGSVLLLNPTTAQPQSTPEELALALDTLRSGGFIEYDQVRPAQLAVVLTGNPTGTDEGNRGSLVARFAGALDARGAGVVVAGRAGSADRNGPVAVVRSDAGLSSATSTVDNVDRQSGRITTVLALQEQLAGGAGRYGTGTKATAVTVGGAPHS
nr:copper transporter [Antrihabitans stalactiti]